MSKTDLISSLTVALGAAAIALVVASPAAAGGGDRLLRRCTALGAGDISMQARYEVRSNRKRFSVEFEAATPGAFAAGQTIEFRVAGVRVGKDRLVKVVGGDVVGELNLDSKGHEPGDDQQPFPGNFPAVQSGTPVKIVYGGKVVLGCNLR